MRTYYLPFRMEFDDESSTWTVTGVDTSGGDFGVAAASSPEAAVAHLRDWVIDSLVASAGDGEDRLSDLHLEMPGGTSSDDYGLALSPVDLMPIRLRAARARHHLTQAEFGERLGISQQAYSKLERPGANLQLKTIQQAERALNEDLLEYA